MTDNNNSEIRDFIEALFGAKPENTQILIWTLKDKRSHWCKDIDAAVESVCHERERDNVYVGVGLSPSDFGEKRRCPMNQIAAIPGVWADFDIADDAHAKPNLPTTQGEIMEVLKDIGLPPTTIIHSGHGIQCYWLFPEIWVFEDDADRARAQSLSQRWNNTIRFLAQKRGWDVDATFDLSRVLRVPGTVNRKTNPVPVRVIFHEDERRVTEAEIEQYILDEAMPSKVNSSKASTEIVVADDLTLDPKAQPDMDLFEQLRESNDKFNLSWLKKRTDMNDQSGSSYDLSLASIALEAGWSDQEVVNLLIAWRRKHHEKEKLRIDYYQKTLTRAKQTAREEEASERLEEAILTGEEPDAETREKMLVYLSRMLQIEITRIVKYILDEPEYRLETTNGSIGIGPVNNLITQTNLRNKIAAAADHIIPTFKGKAWETIQKALVKACESVNVGEDATDKGAMRAWMVTYLEDTPQSPELNETVFAEYTPFMKGNSVCIFGQSFNDFLFRKFGMRLHHKALGVMLKQFGAENRTLPCRIGNRNTSRSIWVLPEWLLGEVAEEGSAALREHIDEAFAHA